MPRPIHHTGKKWKFETARFCVALHIERERGYRYDGDDENGETQRALDSGDFVAFTSRVTVELDGQEIAFDSLHGSVYARDTVADFWTSHRDIDPMNRNCTVMRAKLGANVCICHYFPDMVREAIREARRVIAARRKSATKLPRLREAA